MKQIINIPLSEHELCPDSLLEEQEAAFARDITKLQARQAEFLDVPCPACGTNRSEYIFKKFSFTFKRCSDCGTLYMSPRPTEKIMADYYASSENYAYWAKHIFPASETIRREKIHKPWLLRVIDLAKRHGVTTGRLIEVGPGFGTFCNVAIESGVFREVVAIEPTPELAQACRDRNVPVIESRIEDISHEFESADIVVAFEVIEHLFEPMHFIDQAARLVKPGGLLILSCPNGEGFDIAELGSKSLAVDAEHVNLFNPRSLSAMVEKVGFETIELTTPGRLDAELVRDTVLAGKHNLRSPFLHRILIEEWDLMGLPFQQFLADNGLSSHMWLACRRRREGWYGQGR